MDLKQMYAYVTNFAVKVWPRSKYLVTVLFVKKDKWGGPEYDEWSCLWKEFDDYNKARRQFGLWTTITSGWNPVVVLIMEKNKKIKSNWDKINAYPPSLQKQLDEMYKTKIAISGFTGYRTESDYDIPFEQDEDYEGFVGDEDMTDEIYRKKMFTEFEDDFGALA